MQGKIIKGIAGFYYVHTSNDILYECKAKGIFRKEGIKPLVGDNVELEILSEEDKTGNIIKIAEQKNALIRPAVANVDQALVIFSVSRPMPNLNLLDRFLVTMERQKIPCILCFNKEDLATEEETAELAKVYETCGYPLLFVSAKDNKGVDDMKKLLKNKTTTVAGPSGVGKSSLINCLQEDIFMAIGEISEKIERGRHTTRHTQLIALQDGGYIVDTPGFSSLIIDNLEKEEVKDYYAEFTPYETECRFQGCVHIHEPNCAVKEAVTSGAISSVRYKNYVQMYEECKDKRRY